MMVSQRVLAALNFASWAHRHQYRKGTQIPYISHPVAVMLIVETMTDNEDVRIAALLHDVLEDAADEVSVELLRQKFGSTVTHLVQAVTKRRDLHSWEQRADDYLARLAQAESEVAMIVLADKLHNLQSTLDDYDAIGDQVWQRFRTGYTGQLWWYERICEQLSQQLPYLEQLESLTAMVACLKTLQPSHDS